MVDHDLRRPRGVAEEAARAAAAIVARHYRDGVELLRAKAPGNLVTVADVEAERAIVQIIRSAFPDHVILAEEEHSATAVAEVEHLWVIDPIDGTNNFAHGLDQVGISICYVHKGVPMVGVVANPLRDQWYAATRGQGATVDGKPARVSTHQRLDQVLLGVGFYYDRGAIMEATLEALATFIRADVHGIRRYGAAALDLCLVGAGPFGAFFEYDLNPWDYAAGWLFVEEAGGRVSDARGNPLDLRRSSVVATNGHLHEAVLEVLRVHHPS